MNERQRDLFLFVWSERRKIGAARAQLRGALIGAAGGLAFALFMMQGSTLPGVHAYDAAGQIMSALTMLALSVPAFAFIGWIGARRVFAQEENMYQTIIATGAEPPAQKPAMQLADRWPAIAVGATVVLLVGFILTLIIMFGGAL
ncbi:MAG: hypothetical protein WDM79_10515 [Terricaulis sp.]